MLPRRFLAEAVLLQLVEAEAVVENIHFEQTNVKPTLQQQSDFLFQNWICLAHINTRRTRNGRSWIHALCHQAAIGQLGKLKK
jgi:hypothetical protein